MKKLLIILILIFSIQIPSMADDVSSFEIEGISVGDSLLDHMNKTEIAKALENPSYYKDNKYVAIITNKKSNEFDGNIEVTFNPEDNQYIIHSILLLKNFQNNFEDCQNEKTKTINEINSLIKDFERFNEDSKHEADPDGNSFTYMSTFYPKSGGYLNIKCTDWSDKMLSVNGWFDSLTVSVGSDKFKDFLLNEAWN